MDERQELRTLKRGLKALALLNQMEVISISELARKLGLPRTTAERILLTLASEGYVHRIENDKRYRLSIKVCSLARGFSDESWVTHVASPLLFDFTRRCGWPVSIATPSGINMSVRLTTDPATSLWLTRRRVGTEARMLRSSSGLLYLAFAPQAERDQLLSMIEQSGAPLVVGDSADLACMFGNIRTNGFAFQPGKIDREDSISVPIFVNGSVRAVLLMMYMTRGIRRTEVIATYLPQLKALAAGIADRGDDVHTDFRGIASHEGSNGYYAVAAE